MRNIQVCYISSYPRTTSNPWHTEQPATPVPTKQQGSNQKCKIPAKKPLSYLDAVDDKLVSSKDLLQDATLGIESSCTGITTSCEHCNSTTQHSTWPDVSSHVRSVHASSTTYLKLLHKGGQHSIIRLDSLLITASSDHFHCVFQNTELPYAWSSYTFLSLIFSSTYISLPKHASIIPSRQFIASLVLRISTKAFRLFYRSYFQVSIQYYSTFITSAVAEASAQQSCKPQEQPFSLSH